MCPAGQYRGPVAAATLPDFRPAFDVIDADHDGKISRDDLRSFYSSRSFQPADDDVIASMILAADADRNGFIDFEEFERVVVTAGTCGGGEGMGMMGEVFRVMDRDGDGRVGFEDMKMYVEWAGMGLRDEDVRAMMRMNGGYESDGIGFDDLVKILAVDFSM